MTIHRSASARRDNRAKALHYADIWHDDEQTTGIPMGEECLAYHPTHSYWHLLTDQLDGRVIRLSNSPFGIVVPEETVGMGEDWISVQDPSVHWQGEWAASPIHAELVEALEELQEVTANAEEDGLEVPSEVAFENARRLLKAMYRISPRRFGVYPDYDGYITIDARGANDRIAVVMCGSDGGVLCLATIDNEPRRARYSTARKLPDGFIREALLELGEEPTP